MRTARRVVGWVLLFAVAWVGLAAPLAGAHADLISVDPSLDSIVDTLPETVTFTFTEDITAGPGAVRAINPDGVEVGPITSTTNGGVLTADFSGLSKSKRTESGTWTLSWSAVSADGHPINAAGALHVKVATSAGASLDAFGGDTSAWLVLKLISRLAAFCGLLVLAGGLLWTPLVGRSERAAVTAAALGSLGVVVAAVGMSGGSGAIEGLRLVQQTSAGLMALATVCAVVVAYVVDAVLGSGRRRAAAVWILPLVTLALSGHPVAVVPVWVSILLGVVHVVAACGWIGGLLWLMNPRRTRPLGWTMATQRAVNVELAKFSRVAMVTVAVLAASGVAMGIQRIPLDALLDTAYGNLFLSKVLLLGLALGCAALARFRFGPQLNDGHADAVNTETRDRFELVVKLEAMVVVAALGVGVVMSQTAPPSERVEKTVQQFRAERPFGDYSVTITVDPATVGQNRVTVAVIDPATGSAPTDVTELTIGFQPVGGQVAEISPPLSGPVGSATGSVGLGIAGRWNVVVDARRGVAEFLRARAELTLG